MPYFYLKKHQIKLITLALPHQPRSSRAPDSTPGGKMALETYSSVQFSPVQSSCSIRPWSREHQGATRSNRRHWGAPGSAKEPQGTPASGQLPLFCHTKHTSERKYLKLTQKNARRRKNLSNYTCFVTPNTPRNRKCIIFT